MKRSAYFSAILLACRCIVSSSVDVDCLQVETGPITVDEQKPTVLQIENIHELSCICTPVSDSTYNFMGNEELLVNYYDCGAMRFFGKNLAERWLLEKSEGAAESSHFRYVEVGSGRGLSAHIFTAAVQEAGVPVVAYTHFVPSAESAAGFTATDVEGGTYLHNALLQRIERNGLLEVILPITGDPAETMQTHDDESADLVFMDGDHSYEGLHCAYVSPNVCTAVLHNLRQAWRILKVGGVLLGTAAFPHSAGVNGVERALLQFCFERGFVRPDGSYEYWYLIMATSYMYHFTKESDFQ